MFKNWQMIQSWHGIYPKRTNGETEFIHHPQQGVTIVNGIGGAGMTLSFGLAEEVIGRKRFNDTYRLNLRLHKFH